MILGLDLGVITGVAFGDAGRAPTIFSWDLHDEVRGRRGLMLMQNLFKLLRDIPEIEAVYCEAPPNLQGMMQRGTNLETLRSLYGYDMIAHVVAAKAGLRIEEVDVQKARRHFLGFRPTGGQGKKLVAERCKQLRWPTENNNEADAACVWCFGADMEHAQEAMSRRLAEPARQS